MSSIPIGKYKVSLALGLTPTSYKDLPAFFFDESLRGSKGKLGWAAFLWQQNTNNEQEPYLSKEILDRQFINHQL